jgi:hypothetical protein
MCLAISNIACNVPRIAPSEPNVSLTPRRAPTFSTWNELTRSYQFVDQVRLVRLKGMMDEMDAKRPTKSKIKKR